MNLHTDQATLDTWRTTGSWVMFGAAEPSHVINRIGPDFGKWKYKPPAWMVEAAKPCGCREGSPYLRSDCICLDGRQRHTITVLCDLSKGGGVSHETVDRITVPELAVVEWGPLVVVRDMEDVGSAYWGPACIEVNPDTGYARRWPEWDGALDYDEGDDLTLPPDVDPQSLVGQYAIGGRLVTP